jgi:hypothetical protein
MLRRFFDRFRKPLVSRVGGRLDTYRISQWEKV